MKKIFFFILTIISISSFGQSKIYVRGDSVYIQGAVNSELILLNSTRNLQYGYLQNISNGRTKFHYALDSVWIDGDSLVFRYGPGTLKVIHGGGAGGTTYAAGYGLNLSSTTFKVDTNLISTKLWRQKGVDSILALLASNYYTQTQINSFFGGTTVIGGYNKPNWDAVYAAYTAALANGGWVSVNRFSDSLAAHWAVIQTLAAGPFADMTKAVYDTDNDGIVDNSEQLGGHLPSYYVAIKDSAGALGYATFPRLYKVRDSLAAAYTAAIAAISVKNLSWDATNHEIDIDGGGTSAVIPFATGAAAGLISTTTQTFGGNKTFNGSVYSYGTDGFTIKESVFDGTVGQMKYSSDVGNNSSGLYITGASGYHVGIKSFNDIVLDIPNTSSFLRVKGYGSGTRTGTLTYLSGWDALGNFIEVDPGTIGGSSYTDADVQDYLETYTGDVTATGTVLSLAGIVGGDHTFTGNIYGEGPITWYNTIGFSGNYLGQLGSQSVGSDSYGTIQFGNSANAFQGNIYTDVLTGNRAYTLPDASGQLALTTDLAASVADAINDGTTTVAPSQNVVFDALALKEPTFTETTQEFTGSTSLTLTLSNTLKTSKAVVVFYNGLEMESAAFSASGTTVTLSGFTRETTDRIKVKYSY